MAEKENTPREAYKKFYFVSVGGITVSANLFQFALHNFVHNLYEMGRFDLKFPTFLPPLPSSTLSKEFLSTLTLQWIISDMPMRIA